MRKLNYWIYIKIHKSPVKIEIARYEQYLNGVGRLNVQLDEISN